MIDVRLSRVSGTRSPYSHLPAVAHFYTLALDPGSRLPQRYSFINGYCQVYIIFFIRYISIEIALENFI